MSAPLLLTQFAILVTALILTVIGVARYRFFALTHGIVAQPNFRSLHAGAVPRGGGIVFSAVCIAGVGAIWATGVIDDARLGVAFIAGGVVATVVGFVDDIVQVRPAWKLLVQSALAAGALVCFGMRPLIEYPFLPMPLPLALSWLGLVCLMNAYNFMDGVDGMASGGAAFMGTSVVCVLIARAHGNLQLGDVGVGVVAVVVVICNLGFLVFNRPPASVFMGDAGSLFLGYAMGVLLVKTIVDGLIGPWTWLIILAYFAGDTITTGLVRLFVVRRWYAEHRSHAYQNLARIWHSHLRVVILVSAYQFAWLLPLAIWSVIQPALAPFAAALAILPVIGWTLRHGPLRSSS